MDCNADHADRCRPHLMLGVVTALRRQIERNADLIDAQLDKLGKALVALTGLAESGINAHGKCLGPIYGGTIAAGAAALQTVENPLCHWHCCYCR
jgi:hypothetical protein